MNADVIPNPPKCFNLSTPRGRFHLAPADNTFSKFQAVASCVAAQSITSATPPQLTGLTLCGVACPAALPDQAITITELVAAKGACQG